MDFTKTQSEHSFHIPVMGIAFTIDTPIKVAKYGISSVVSIVEDRLIEMMREHYYPLVQEKYIPISTHEEDYRAKRITDYLNLMQRIVQDQMTRLKCEAFEKGTELVKYFEMLPESSRLKNEYHLMVAQTDPKEKIKQQDALRYKMVAGSIDVNIMTKVDRDHKNAKGELLQDASDAVAALRGYANSTLSNSSVVFSAGMNPRLYSYMETLHAFDPDEHFQFRKKVIIKVSDFRSALIQGKFLAKKGIWVSEFRIESGLNCGGHAFATEGYLLGPILNEFKEKKNELFDSIFQIYLPVIEKKLGRTFVGKPALRFSVQGGIGTHEEDEFLRSEYEVDSTGWGTPFLLVPEATTVDSSTMQLLASAQENDIQLSHRSPLGVRFHYLRNTTADLEKEARIRRNRPGSPCTEKHLAFNTEFSDEPICTASSKYQKLKLNQLKTLNLSLDEYEKQKQSVLDKECLCIGLSNSASINYDKSFVPNFHAVNICPGPNIVNFTQVVSLQKMTDHIYGRDDIIQNNHRPHMFIAELILYMNFLNEQLSNEKTPITGKQKNYYLHFIQQLQEGISYYFGLATHYSFPNQFIKSLNQIQTSLLQMNERYFTEQENLVAIG